MTEFKLDELRMMKDIMERIIRSYEPDNESFVKKHRTLYQKIVALIEESLPEVPASICECSDKYHPNGAICLKEHKLRLVK